MKWLWIWTPTRTTLNWALLWSYMANLLSISTHKAALIAIILFSMLFFIFQPNKSPKTRKRLQNTYRQPLVFCGIPLTSIYFKGLLTLKLFLFAIKQHNGYFFLYLYNISWFYSKYILSFMQKVKLIQNKVNIHP